MYRCIQFHVIYFVWHVYVVKEMYFLKMPH